MDFPPLPDEIENKIEANANYSLCKTSSKTRFSEMNSFPLCQWHSSYKQTCTSIKGSCCITLKVSHCNVKRLSYSHILWESILLFYEKNIPIYCEKIVPQYIGIMELRWKNKKIIAMNAKQHNKQLNKSKQGKRNVKEWIHYRERKTYF